MSTLIVDARALSQAATFAEQMRLALSEGVSGAEAMDRSLPVGIELDALALRELRRLGYAMIGMLGASGKTWTAATLLNSFTNYGGGYAPAGYSRDINGRVEIRGLVARASAALVTPVFTLPVGFRPAYSRGFTVTANQNSCRVDIFPSGTVWVDSAVSATWFNFFFLDGISFDTGA